MCMIVLVEDHKLMAAGVRGYVLKDDILEVIVGIQHVLKGGVYLTKQLDEEII